MYILRHIQKRPFSVCECGQFKGIVSLERFVCFYIIREEWPGNTDLVNGGGRSIYRGWTIREVSLGFDKVKQKLNQVTGY